MAKNNEPKNWYQTDDGNWFVNPYNFVPLNDIARRSIDEWRGEKTERLCGSIHCKLTLKTPLALPDHAHKSTETVVVNGKEEVHPSYPFMSIDGPAVSKSGGKQSFISGSERPFIPGSELRGMIRSVYEAATGSCLSILDDSPLTGRSYDVKKAGILKREGEKWVLYEGAHRPIKTFNNSKYSVFTENGKRYLHTPDDGDLPNLSRVYFLSQDKQPKYIYDIWPYDGKYKESDGYLLIGEIGIKENTNRHCSHVIFSDFKIKHAVSQAELENFNSVLASYADEKKNSAKDYKGGKEEIPGKEYYHTGYVDYDLNGNDTLPVFYEIVNGKLHLAPALYSRELYYKTMDEVVGEHKPCSRHGKNGGKDAVCPACALFGTIREGDKNGRSYGSAVRFGDAIASSYKFVANPNNNQPIPATLKELAGPKPSAAEFYTTRPNVYGIPRTWNFEYARIRDRNARGKIRRELCSDLKIRGRKFYYHWTDVKEKDYSATVKTGRNVTVDLLEKGSFDFDVFFDGISKKQLYELIWCLSPKDPDDAEALFCHKLGMGKPLGLGSVHVDVERVNIREYNAQDLSYKITEHKLSDNDGFTEEFNETAKALVSTNSDLLFMLRCDKAREWSVGYPAQGDGRKGGISYPIADNGEENDENRCASYQWFAGNRQIANDSDDRGKGADPKFYQELPAPHDVATPDKRLRTLIKK